MSRIKILFVFGGESTEHEVSLDSARYVSTLLKPELYEVTLCYIDQQGLWWHADDFAQIDAKQLSVQYSARFGTGEVVATDGRILKPDAVLPILLGNNGEDGAIQGLAQLLHIPVVGCGVLGSAICMDKDVTKRLLHEAGIGIVDYVLCQADEPAPKYAGLRTTLGDTLFIKPASQGSSIGVVKVRNEAEFITGLAEAFVYDNKVLIERAVQGVEVGCGIIGNEQPEPSAVSKIDNGQNDFFTYEAKYSLASTAIMQIPAHLPEAVAKEIQSVAVHAYQVLACLGYARVDMFLTDDGQILVNELNTLPAFRDDSSFPKLWKAVGVKPDELWDKIIGFALSVDS